MAKFTAAPGLNEMVARMVAPEVHRIAKRVEVTAKRLAPAAKRWVSMGDNLVRDTHREADAKGVLLPDNLRFAVRGQPWDIEHGLSPGVDYMLRPKDTTSGLPIDAVQNVHCRCHAALLPAAIAEAIKTSPPQVRGSQVRVTVSCTFYQIVACEWGEVYPGGAKSPGTHFMARAAARVAGNGGGYGPGARDLPSAGNYTADPGQGNSGNQ